MTTFIKAKLKKSDRQTLENIDLLYIRCYGAKIGSSWINRGAKILRIFTLAFDRNRRKATVKRRRNTAHQKVEKQIT